jgi:hypothetical protein
MNNDIRESLGRLEQVRTADLAGIDSELTTLLTALHKEVEAQTSIVNTADSTNLAYGAAANDLVGLLQLTQAAANSKKELDKLVFSAGKAIGRVMKKAPK